MQTSARFHGRRMLQPGEDCERCSAFCEALISVADVDGSFRVIQCIPPCLRWYADYWEPDEKVSQGRICACSAYSWVC